PRRSGRRQRAGARRLALGLGEPCAALYGGDSLRLAAVGGPADALLRPGIRGLLVARAGGGAGGSQLVQTLVRGPVPRTGAAAPPRAPCADRPAATGAGAGMGGAAPVQHGGAAVRLWRGGAVPARHWPQQLHLRRPEPDLPPPSGPLVREAGGIPPRPRAATGRVAAAGLRQGLAGPARAHHPDRPAAAGAGGLCRP